MSSSHSSYSVQNNVNFRVITEAEARDKQTALAFAEQTAAVINIAYTLCARGGETKIWYN